MKKRALQILTLGLALTALSAWAAPPDPWLTAKTKVALWTKGNVRGTSVNVDTNDGVVTLHGKVATAQEKSAAERVARGIEGVHKVRNLLQVVPEARDEQVEESDEQLEQAVQDKLQADPSLEDSDIEVKSVNKGLVLLSGDAKSYSAHARAVSLVNQVPGVRRIVSEVNAPNQFSAKEQGLLSSADDLRMSTEVKLKLLQADDVPATDINVDAQNGTVFLFGAVRNPQQKQAAATQAREVEGVKGVENQLQVNAAAPQKTAQVSDGELSRSIERAFKNRREFQGVTTSVENGAVTLTGTVPSAWDQVSALRTARKVSGVRGVKDQLEIKYQGTTAPERRY